MLSLRFLASMVALFAAAGPLVAQGKGLEWPAFRGPSGAGVSAARGLPDTWSQTANLAWKIELPGRGASSPIVAGDRIYVTCYSGYGPPAAKDITKLKRHVLGLDRQGKIVWDTEAPSRLPEQEGIRDDHGYASSTPLCDGERLYVFFGKSGVFAYSLDGKQLWHAEVGEKLNGWGTAASPLLVDDLLIINASVESESLIALDRKSGKERWRTRGIRESWNTPILVSNASGKKEIVLAIMGKVMGVDPASGNVLWTCTTDIPWYMVPSLVAHGDVVFCTGGRGGGGTLAVKTGGSGDVTKSHRLWFIKNGSNVPSPVYHDGHLYFVIESSAIFHCVDAKTGAVVYAERHERAGQIYASPILVGNKLYYLSRQGVTTVIPASPRFEVLTTADLRDRTAFNASPAVAGDQLLIRSDRHLYCVGK